MRTEKIIFKSGKEVTIRYLDKNTDDRGTLIEVLRSDIVGQFNQIYSASIKPGKIRGGHYHKNRKEWFCVLIGEGTYEIKDMETGEIKDIVIGNIGEDWQYMQIELVPGLWHSITNTGRSDLVFVSAISDCYDKQNPDTYRDE